MFRKILLLGNIGLGILFSVFIFERIVILCFVSFLYIVKNFYISFIIFFCGRSVWRKKNWRLNIFLVLKYVFYRIMYLFGKLVMSDC